MNGISQVIGEYKNGVVLECLEQKFKYLGFQKACFSRLGRSAEVAATIRHAQRNLVQKKVIVRNISAPCVGTELAPTETIDTALGFYLRS